MEYTHDFYPYDPDLVFWDVTEFGPTVTKAERLERVSIAEELMECWDRLRDVPKGKAHLAVNNACARVVQAFGETMKLNHRESLVLMDHTMAVAAGGARRLLLLASADLIERHERRKEAAV